MRFTFLLQDTRMSPHRSLKQSRGGGVLGDAREGLPPLPLGLALPKGLALPIGLPTPPIGEGGEGLWDPLSPLQPPPSGDPDSSLKKVEK